MMTPQLISMSPSIRWYMGVLLASLSTGEGTPPKQEPRPVVKATMVAPPATWPVVATGS